MFFPLGSLYIYYHSARIQAASGRLSDVFGCFSDGFGTVSAFSAFSAASGGFSRFRALLPVGAGCAQARVAYWRVFRLGKLRHGHVVASCTRVHRRVGVRTGVCCSQSRFCLRIAEIPPKSQRVCPDSNVSARMAAFSSELRISFRIARFSCELPIYSRMTACLLGRRSFRPTAVISPERRCACGIGVSTRACLAYFTATSAAGARRQIRLMAVRLA